MWFSVDADDATQGLVERCSGLLSVPKDQIQLHALDENNAPVLSLAGYGNFVMARSRSSLYNTRS